jgi:hypothetical protein
MPKLVLLLVVLMGGFCLSARAEEDYAAFFPRLLEQSDPVIVATPQTDCGGCLGSGPCVAPGEDKWVRRYDEFLPQLKVNQVLKGNIATDKILWVSYIAMTMVNGKDMVELDPKAPKGSPQNPVFQVGRAKDEAEEAFPDAPHKGIRYIFFLSNSKLHKPKSYEAAGTHEIIYRNFDFQQGMIPATNSAISKIRSLSSEGQP